jgi:DNA-binding response OmpR family regulator
LILEDDREVRDLLSDALRLDGHRTRCCSNAKDFRVEAARQDFDLFLIDVNLPDGDGFDIARDLRRKTKGGIILVTGRRDEVDAVLGLEVGADDYVAKPFRMRELRARVKAVSRRIPDVRQEPQEAETRYQVRGLTIDRRARILRQPDNRMVDLTTLEFDLLVVLTTPPNVVLSRDEIMNRLRGPNWSAYDRTIDGLIGRLRAKLFDDRTGREVIKTIRGAGYMFSVED